MGVGRFCSNGGKSSRSARISSGNGGRLAHRGLLGPRVGMRAAGGEPMRGIGSGRGFALVDQATGRDVGGEAPKAKWEHMLGLRARIADRERRAGGFGRQRDARDFAPEAEFCAGDRLWGNNCAAEQ